MESNIYFKDVRIVGWKRIGKSVWASLENGESVKRKECKNLHFSIQCKVCGNKHHINFYYKCDEKPHECYSCRLLGEKNPFFGKTHSEDTRIKMSECKIGKDSPMKGKSMSESGLLNVRRAAKKRKDSGIYDGKNNPFYGKKHSIETIAKIEESRSRTISSWSIEQKLRYSKNLSNGQKRLMEKDHEKYIKNKTLAGKISHLSQLRKYQMNKIEKIVESEFIKLGLYPKYSTILGYYQFDFGFKPDRILLEVQGDYWHGNPNKFNADGSDGKRKLNDTQKEKICRDVKKAKFAIDNELKLYYIWEEDIMRGNFKVLNDIKNEIQNNKT